MSADPIPPPPFDWQNPDYAGVYRERASRISRMRAHPEIVPGLRDYYGQHLAQFISDFGTTSDPRGALLSPPRPVTLPFMLFPKQIELVDWMIARIQGRESGICEKSRDCGASWISMAIACCLCLFRPQTAVGVGSAKQDLVDRTGDPASLLWKARAFLLHLPPEFRGGWEESKHSAYMRVTFPNGSSIIGQSGDDIGRGSRTSFFIIDEAAHIPHDELVDNALASTSDCTLWISSVRGRDNSFARKRFSGKFPVFSFHWTADPRKDRRWYERQCETLDPVTVAQEIDINYAASVEGVLIPNAWAQAAVGAAEKLGIEVSGVRRAALDVADQGADSNCFAGRHGILLKNLQTWSGAGSDIFETTTRAFALCDQFYYNELYYDADGLGAGVRGDANVINRERSAAGRPPIVDEPFRGSAAPADPMGEIVPGRTNQDYFLNQKAMAWMSLRQRFRNTYRAVMEDVIGDPDSLISISQTLPELDQLLVELSMPTFSMSAAGKVVIDKLAGGRSPNRADAVMMAFAPLHGEGGFFQELLTPPVSREAEAAQLPTVELPQRCDVVYASASAALESDPEALAVVYFAASLYNSRNPLLVVIDWDLEQLGGPVLQDCLPRFMVRLEQLATECNALQGFTGIALDPDGIGDVLFEDAIRRGIDVRMLRESVLTMDPLKRGVAASGHVQLGRVKIARPALEKIVNYKQSSRNYLLSIAQFGVRQDPATAGPLLPAFANGVLEALTTDNLRRRGAS